MQHFLVFSGFSFKISRDQSLSSFYRTLVGWANVPVKRGRFREKQENHSAFLRFCAFLGIYMALFCKAILLSRSTLETKRMGSPGGKTSSGENALCLSNCCVAIWLQSPFLRVE